MSHDFLNRRQFGKIVASTSLAASLPLKTALGRSAPAVAKPPIRLGFDNFSIRACNWKADRIIDFAAEQQVDSVLFSDLDVFENHTPDYLKTLAAKARDQGIFIQSGTGGICPTAGRFIKKWGTAEEHLKLCIRVAADVGSDVVRCYLGGQKDREGAGGIQRHIDETVKLLTAVKPIAVDAGVKIAVENHAGDMQAWELIGLIEAAGKDFVGATLDSGNATWTLEHPLNHLELLGPYAACSGIRDSTIWEVEQGAKVAWNAIGEGQVDWKQYVERWQQLCPDVPFQLEIISGFNKLFAYHEEEFWDIFPEAKAQRFRGFPETGPDWPRSPCRQSWRCRLPTGRTQTQS